MPSATAVEVPERATPAGRALSALVRAARPFVLRHGAALCLLALGLGMIAARGPLPVDETRYIEVAREFRSSEPLTLQLNGVPYAHKPPLAFWIAELLHRLGLPIEPALRLVPVLATAATCVLVARLGRRLGIRHAEWVFAATLLPLGYAQVLLLDPVLVLAVWLALDAWWHGRDLGAAGGAALAFLAKGPVAALFLVPLGLALAPLRPPRSGRRAAVVVDVAWSVLALVWLLGAAPRLELLLGAEARTPVMMAWAVVAGTTAACVLATTRSRVATPARLLADVGQGASVLAAWAFEASLRGGAKFAQDLLVHQTSDRLTESFAHSQPFWFYLPVLAVGLLPTLPVLTFGRSSGGPLRLAVAVVATLLMLSFIDQKQPHYLLPLIPALAVVAAQLIDLREGAAAAWRTGARWMLGALLVVNVLAWPVLLLAPSRYASQALALAGSPRAWLVWGLTSGAAMLAIVFLRRDRAPLSSSAAAFLCGVAVIALPAHSALDLLTTPDALKVALRTEPQTPLALYRCFQGGYFNWLGEREHVTRLEGPEDLLRWCEGHPGGLLMSFDESGSELTDVSLCGVVHDSYRGRGVELFRVESYAGAFP